MQAWKRYTQNEFETSNPIKNTIYIYERCIIEFKKIDQAFAGLHFSTADLLLDKMEKIFEELKLQLNPEADTELYENIYRLYTWISEQIREMQVLRQAVNIDPIIHVITQLKEGYEGVMQHAKSDNYLG
ncbi:flagellar export chaperone FliS [Listeria ilorinensis]|uniref:flagellar export chaperone FliS n=1 Tax=Listeria ilorinensis TaxID=2867439 RepID=UPI001EF49E0E|nr:flagellar protein FliS [Listeria ilorinensis]